MGNKANNKSALKGEKGGQNRSWKALSQDVGAEPVTSQARRRKWLPILKAFVFCGCFAGIGYGGYYLQERFGDLQRSVVSGLGENPLIADGQL